MIYMVWTILFGMLYKMMSKYRKCGQQYLRHSITHVPVSNLYYRDELCSIVSPILITLNVSSAQSIDTLEKQRLYGDLTLCYKMLYSHSTLVFAEHFILNNSNTRQNNNYKVKEQPSKINVKSIFCTIRDTRACNSLSEVIQLLLRV